MQRVRVLIAGLALIGAGLFLGARNYGPQNYPCGSVLEPASRGGFVFDSQFEDCQTQLDAARTSVYALLGLGAAVALTGGVWILVGTRADRKANRPA